MRAALRGFGCPTGGFELPRELAIGGENRASTCHHATASWLARGGDKQSEASWCWREGEWLWLELVSKKATSPSLLSCLPSNASSLDLPPHEPHHPPTPRTKPRTAMAKPKKRLAFVTVGTTRFDALVQVSQSARLRRNSAPPLPTRTPPPPPLGHDEPQRLDDTGGAGLHALASSDWRESRADSRNASSGRRRRGGRGRGRSGGEGQQGDIPPSEKTKAEHWQQQQQQGGR